MKFQKRVIFCSKPPISGVGCFICNGIWTEDSGDFPSEDFQKRGFLPERISGRILGSEDSFRRFLKGFTSEDSRRGFRKDFGDSLSTKTTKLFKKCIHCFLFELWLGGTV